MKRWIHKGAAALIALVLLFGGAMPGAAEEDIQWVEGKGQQVQLDNGIASFKLEEGLIFWTGKIRRLGKDRSSQFRARKKSVQSFRMRRTRPGLRSSNIRIPVISKTARKTTLTRMPFLPVIRKERPKIIRKRIRACICSSMIGMSSRPMMRTPTDQTRLVFASA
ncbi:hypothetical protein ABD76_09835 [Paenibacillus dendritiformis]|nr:hypothetical protein [Paenibacillus dendritiformis]